MLNLLALAAQSGRSMIVTPNRLLNIQVTEALRAQGLVVYSSADTSPAIAISMFATTRSAKAALVSTLPRMIGDWRLTGVQRLIFVRGRMSQKEADAFLNQYSRSLPGATRFAFNSAEELYAAYENRKAAYHVDLETVEERLDGDILKMVAGKVSV